MEPRGDRSASQPALSLRREGDVWVIDHAGRTIRLRHLKGLSYLDILLHQPGRDVHVLDLVGAPRQLDTGPLEHLDAQARTAYRERLRDLGEELEEAEITNDIERASLLRVEADALVDELTRGTALAGRSRASVTPSERARVAVTKAIKVAVARIGDADPTLGRHLQRTVRTGRFCCYAAEASRLLAADDQSGSPEQPTSVITVGGRTAPLPFPPAGALSSGEFFVGRSEELGRLARSWKEVQTGERRLVLVGGEPGVGKTRLAAEVARAAHAEGGVVLWGRCDEELAVAYQPFTEALRHWLVNAPADDVAAWAERPELGRVLSDPGEARPQLVPTLGADPEGERLALFEAVGSLLRALAESSPVVLVLDDLHWATAPTLFLLRHLVRDPAPGALLIMGTYRDTDLGRTHPLANVLADLRRGANVERLSLGRLTEASVVEYVEAAAGESLVQAGAELATTIYEQTEGNPFFVDQVLRHLTESGRLAQVDGQWRATVPLDQLGLPDGVREVVGRRLSRLSDHAYQALTVAAALGRDFDLRTLEAVPESGEPGTLLEHIEEAVAAHLVDERAGAPGRFSFAHVLVRQTILAELTAARQARLHRRIGEALAAQRTASVAAVAYHLCAGADGDAMAEAMPWVERAIDEAWRRRAFEEAVAIGERALQALALADAPLLGAEASVLTRMAMSAQFLGDLARHIELAAQATAVARQAGDAAMFGRAVIARSAGAAAGVPDPEAGPLLSEALDRLGDDDPGLRAGLLATRALSRALNQNEGLAAEPEARHAVELARTSGNVQAQLIALYTHWLVVLGSPEVSIGQTVLDDMNRLRESASPEQLHRHGSPLTWARVAVVTRLVQGDRAGAGTAIAEVRQASGAGGGGRLVVAITGMWQAMLDLADGRLDDAECNAAALVPLVDSDLNFRNSWAELSFRIAQERDEVGTLVPEVRTAAAQTPGLVALRALLALALAEADELDEARSVFTELASGGFATLPRNVLWSAVLSQLTEVCVTLGDRVAAADLHRLLLPFAGQVLVVAWGVYCPGAADRYIGALAGLLGHGDEVDARFSAALALEESMAAPALQAHTRVWWASALADRGGPGDAGKAQDLLDQAVAVAEPLGLVALTRDAARVAARLRS